ncbi:ADP-ribose pyrophosphatase [Nakamurella panacisegetis]|uniref:ADP-ribose pyrophosphatase n=1 Tax=Nakamurella panacisegetis TaxID=1090615 RepID=A0A1H0PTE7_9ACTN|nr:NUDIX hydrolase [Nakamurella panacisegetis]SDP07806.1 ADP-ribose pyrophosphatase [Nakamurella panacisegetis]
MSRLFEVTDSEKVWSGHIAAVRIDTLVMPGGGTARREVVEHDRAVAVVALDDEGSVVLLEQFRHPLRRRLWELPAGLMDFAGESARSAAERELGEETGLHAAHWSVLVDIASSPGFTDEAVRVFLATGLTHIGRQGDVLHEEADLKVVRVPLEVAVRGVFQGRIVNGSSVSGLLAAAVALGIDTDITAASLRPADDPWNDASAVSQGPGIPDAPALDV